MCLAVPGEILSIEKQGEERSGRIRFGGVTREVNLAYVPEARVGDYVIVHVGFAISLLDEEEAKKTLSYLEEMETLSELGES